MKRLKRVVVILVCSPFVLITFVFLYEIYGIYANQAATDRQTMDLQVNLKQEISDIEIKDVYSETGNTSGTGNHVDCLTVITFFTEIEENEIKDKMSWRYDFDELYGDCYIEQVENCTYKFVLRETAPFADNIVGH